MSTRRPIVWLLLAALLTAVNLHLPALQVAAWTGMLLDYSRGNSLVEAVDMTFGGDHPCPMCKAIEKQQTAAHDEVLEAGPAPTLLGIVEIQPRWIHTLSLIDSVSDLAPGLARGAHTPETPPPRSVHG